ncbi:DUF1800 domain-containing protein [Luteibaculum oceani]|uniref:DUF1800 domain-containing protein n=1 Tax=Luteibaculum oceani TaxID=1294296 RepID=A0A5C6UVU1_9FLAO|nr:DUF1800 domain-containing protein [Luteibaculum oceani]TXC77089.1 DUF1800 domain-containing protein [Luteibaculum oceani]
MSIYPPLLEKPQKEPSNKYANKKPPHYYHKVSGLEPYEGPWTRDTARHLLSRTCFGFTKADLDIVAQQGLQASLTEILTQHQPYSSPINDYYNQISDPDCAPEASWVDKNISADPMINNARMRSYQGWWLGEMAEQPRSIFEKMKLFWHNHFATQISTVNFPQFAYGTSQLIGSHALGNFKTLTKQITFDPGMLVYLNGYKNQKNRPDENYARELQELFTIGKGATSKYTEEDVRQAARVLTGWTFDQNLDVTFIPNWHDTGDKQFSAFYENKVIKGGSNGELEFDELLNMIFAKQEVAEFLMSKLYRFFVYYVIDDEIQQKVITPLANIFRDNNYEILPVLQALFNSAHFFDAYTRGAIIKNPMDFMIGHLKATGYDTRRENPTERSRGFYIFNILGAVLQMQIGEPPNVAGWSAYYQAPQYHEHWINSVTLPKRNQITDVIMIPPTGLRLSGTTTFLDILPLTEDVPNAEEPVKLVDYWEDLCFSKGLSAEQKDSLKSILLYGQTEDYYWTIAWQDYLGDKQNPQKKQLVYNLLLGFYKQLFNLPEYQLS